jgi:hypothetical protein
MTETPDSLLRALMRERLSRSIVRLLSSLEQANRVAQLLDPHVAQAPVPVLDFGNGGTIEMYAPGAAVEIRPPSLGEIMLRIQVPADEFLAAVDALRAER